MRLEDCQDCPLWEGANAVPGYGPLTAEMMIVGEAPGYHEDKTRQPFVGQAGVKLDIMLEKGGFKRADVFVTNLLKHRPPKNRNPKASEVSACSHWLHEEIEAVEPHVIIAMGRFAINWFDKTIKLAQDHGRPRKLKLSEITQWKDSGARLKKQKAVGSGKEPSDPNGMDGLSLMEESNMLTGSLGVSSTAPSHQISGSCTSAIIPNASDQSTSMMETECAGNAKANGKRDFVIFVPCYHPAAALHNPNLWPVMLEDWGRLPERLMGKEQVEVNYKLVNESEVLEYLK
jgi:uracil-DNA glycosylase family 4